jgi:hypothetical protein
LALRVLETRHLREIHRAINKATTRSNSHYRRIPLQRLDAICRVDVEACADFGRCTHRDGGHLAVGWRPNWTGDFFMADGLFARYQLWLAVAIGAQTSVFILNR